MLTTRSAAGRALGVVLAAVTAAACQTSSADQQRDGTSRLLGFEQMQQEYRDKAAGYENPLPPGVTFPDAVPPPQQPTRYERGNGVVLADTYWRCAWMRAWLDAHDRGKPTAEATTWLERAPETEYMRKYLVPEGTEQWRAVVDRAKLGDPSLLREYFQSGCDFYEVNNA